MEAHKISLSGQSLIDTIIDLTELPEEWARKEFESILDCMDQPLEILTLEDIKQAMIHYLETLIKDFNELD